MNNYNQNQPYGSSSGYVYQDAALQSTLLQRVFLWMAMGLAITGLTAYLTYSSNLLYMLSPYMGGLILLELGIVFGMSFLINRISSMVATLLFGLYSLINGLTLSVIFAVYTMESIASTFFIAAGTFGAMAFFGYVTKRDLSRMGSILMMALIGLVIAGVVNIFLKSSMLSFVTSAIGVLVFTGLTAWDMQKIKNMFADVQEDGEEVRKYSVFAALTLYLDFVNLFLYLLRLFGSRRD